MSTEKRYNSLTSNPNRENTKRNDQVDYQEPAYAATIALKLNAALTVVKPGTLTGALTLNAETTRPKIGDRLTVMFLADGTQRIVTPGAAFAGAGTLTVAINKRASLSAMFDGTKWVEIGRVIEA